MATYTVLTFAAARDVCGSGTVEIDLPRQTTVAALRAALIQTYPALGELSSFAVAKNQTFAGEEAPLTPGDELAIIPPVSGG